MKQSPHAPCRLFSLFLGIGLHLASILTILGIPVLLMQSSAQASPKSAYRGWDHLVKKLIEDGVPKDQVHAVYLSPEFPEFTEVPFKLQPKESHRSYELFFQESKMGLAKQFIQQHRKSLEAAERRYAVPASLIAAILLVETQYGRYTGSHMVLYRLSRVASVGQKENLQAVFRQLKKEDPSVQFQDLKKRAQYLEEMFYPEIPALFTLAQETKNNPLKIMGSYAGAFGIPQFLPSTFLRCAVDGNGDGKRSLFQMEDAIFSAANFFHLQGWKDSLSEKEKKKIIWGYNRSEAYVDTIFALKEKIQARYLPIPSTHKAVDDKKHG